MSSAEELFEEQCAASLARVRVIGAVSQALDELARGDFLQAGYDAFDEHQERELQQQERS